MYYDDDHMAEAEKGNDRAPLLEREDSNRIAAVCASYAFGQIPT